MALGQRKSGGNFLPMLKYDARVGTMFLQDRVFEGGRWETEQKDVTREFRATFDLETAQRGWINFPKGAAPQTVLVPFGQDPGDPPTGEYKEGVRILVKMDANLSGDVREFMSTALAIWNAIDALHDAYLDGAAANPGALPVVDLETVKETKMANGTAFTPVFKIVDWTPRPPDLPKTAAARTAPPKAATRPKVRSIDDDLDNSFDNEAPF
jgi:hypothetical protein